MRQPVGPGGHLLSVLYPVQVRAQASGGSTGQLRTSAPQSSQNTQSSFQSSGTGSISSLVQQINAQLNNVLSGIQPGQVNQLGQVNVTSTSTNAGVEGNVGVTDDAPLQTSEQVSVSGYLLSISLSLSVHLTVTHTQKHHFHLFVCISLTDLGAGSFYSNIGTFG